MYKRCFSPLKRAPRVCMVLEKKRDILGEKGIFCTALWDFYKIGPGNTGPNSSLSLRSALNLLILAFSSNAELLFYKLGGD